MSIDEGARRLLTLGLAVALAAGTAATVSAAGTHQPICRQESHHRGLPVMTPCCCDGDSTPGSIPVPRAELTSPIVASSPMAVVAVASRSAGVPAQMFSPRHGYQFVSLPVLLSTFLI